MLDYLGESENIFLHQANHLGTPQNNLGTPLGVPTPGLGTTVLQQPYTARSPGSVRMHLELQMGKLTVKKSAGAGPEKGHWFSGVYSSSSPASKVSGWGGATVGAQ